MDIDRPVVAVSVDVPLAHLDRTFDYLISESDYHLAVPGTRVKVRFAGKLVSGFVLERKAASEHQGKLAQIDRLISPEVVLTAEIRELVRATADRSAGTFSDVVRLAVPPRNAATEKAEPKEPAHYETVTADRWSAYELGPGFVAVAAAGSTPRAIWSATAGEDWPACLAQLAGTVAAAGRGAVIIVPDERDLHRLRGAMREVVGSEGFAELSSAAGPAARYRQFLRCARGEVQIAIGTRSAIFAPLANVGLVAIWDDGDDLYQEPRAPYFHSRDVAVLRAHRAEAALLMGGFGQSVAATALLERRWAKPLRAARETLRARTPRIMAAGDDLYLKSDAAAHSARLPSIALQTTRTAIGNDLPVLIHVPRRGYVPALACERCRTPARCNRCAGPLGQSHAAAQYAACRWCGIAATAWTCQVCSGNKLRAVVMGTGRTAEEFGRMVPGTRVIQSAGDHVVDQIEPGPALVIATPGAEPVVAGGYGAALLMDGWAYLSRPDLSATEEALRRWLNAAALVRPAASGGRVVVMAPAQLPVVQALVRWSPAWLAERELADRVELRFPPAVRMAALIGDPSAVLAASTDDGLPINTERLGPVRDVRTPQLERILLRVPIGQGAALAGALAVIKARRSAVKAADRLRVVMDPPDIE